MIYYNELEITERLPQGSFSKRYGLGYTNSKGHRIYGQEEKDIRKQQRKKTNSKGIKQTAKE